MIIGYLRNPHPPAADAGFAANLSWGGSSKKKAHRPLIFNNKKNGGAHFTTPPQYADHRKCQKGFNIY